MSLPENVHATGIVLGKTGVIFRGPSGAGKSLLALELIDEWDLRGEGGKLVSDDRIDVAVEKGGLFMMAPKTIEGLVELRGRGIVSRPFVRKAPIHLVVDLVPGLERMVEEDALETTLLGVKLPRCPVPQAGVVDARHQLLLIREALRHVIPRKPAPRQKDT
ncbi:MAG TPA: HPr kinase/phosphatase C-terminal domain-containing protein [Devosia sp.]